MEKLLLTVSIILLNSFVIAQNVSFKENRVLFEHPKIEDSDLNYPYMPFDYNSDGFTDFIGATFNDQFIYKGLENNNFEQIDIYQGQAQSPLKFMDFDKDGDTDVVMRRYINLYESEDNFKFLGLGINFQETIVEVADFNNDGFYDLLTHKAITFENDELIIHYNQGDNTFINEVIYNNYDYADIAVGDIDNNGNIDIAILIEFEEVPIVLLYNQGDSFEVNEIPNQFDIGRTTLKLLDLDSDNDLDIVTLGIFDDIFILENTDNFSNDDTMIILNQNGVLYFNTGDVNNDGLIDVIAVIESSQGYTIKVFEASSAFNFSASYESETFMGSDFISYPNFNYVINNLQIYDYNNDGLLDIIYTNGFGEPNQILLLENDTEPTSTKESLDNYNSDAISIFPNPVDQSIHISNNIMRLDFNYEIFSISGKVVMRGNCNTDIINVSQLHSGLYVIKSIDLGLIKRFVKR